MKKTILTIAAALCMSACGDVSASPSTTDTTARPRVVSSSFDAADAPQLCVSGLYVGDGDEGAPTLATRAQLDDNDTSTARAQIANLEIMKSVGTVGETHACDSYASWRIGDSAVSVGSTECDAGKRLRDGWQSAKRDTSKRFESTSATSMQTQASNDASANYCGPLADASDGHDTGFVADSTDVLDDGVRDGDDTGDVAVDDPAVADRTRPASMPMRTGPMSMVYDSSTTLVPTGSAAADGGTKHDGGSGGGKHGSGTKKHDGGAPKYAIGC